MGGWVVVEEKGGGTYSKFELSLFLRVEEGGSSGGGVDRED